MNAWAGQFTAICPLAVSGRARSSAHIAQVSQPLSQDLALFISKQFVAGVLYLNRDNIRLLPAGGAIWTPNDDWRFELLFPKPKFGMRVNVGPGFEDWIFTTAESGGNTWAIVRDSGAQDRVTYLDYRLLVGYERKLDGGAGYRLGP